MSKRPLILCIGGLDPTGGAGIQADIESVTAMGGRAMALVTCLTAQDTRDIVAILPTDAGFLSEQITALTDDLVPDAVKIGLLGSSAAVAPIGRLLKTFAGPVVVDPILAAGGGFELGSTELMRGLIDEILPQVDLLTPNRQELRRLSGMTDVESAADWLMTQGPGAILVTGADEAEGGTVVNRLYRPTTQRLDFRWPRLPGTYHGSGCTLASACATCLALGQPIDKAVEQAQSFTWLALQNAITPGRGQHLPDRLP